MFQEYHYLLKYVGEGNLDEQTAADVELFICKVYNEPNVITANKARSNLYVKSHAPEILPSTSVALSFSHTALTLSSSIVETGTHKQSPELHSPEMLG